MNHLMKLNERIIKTILLGVAVVLLVSLWIFRLKSGPERVVEQLLEYHQKRVDHLAPSEYQRFCNILTAYLPRETIRELCEHKWMPYCFVKLDESHSEQLRLLVTGQPCGAAPCTSYLRFYVFSEAKQNQLSEFKVGVRLEIDQVTIGSNQLFPGIPICVVTTHPLVGGPPIGKLYYAILHDRVMFIRQEDESGRLLAPYLGFADSAGPVFPNRSKEDWVLRLNSQNPLDVIESLNWHLVEYEGRHRLTPIDSETLNIVRMLKTSKNPWLVEMATKLVD